MPFIAGDNNLALSHELHKAFDGNAFFFSYNLHLRRYDFFARRIHLSCIVHMNILSEGRKKEYPFGYSLR